MKPAMDKGYLPTLEAKQLCFASFLESSGWVKRDAKPTFSS